MKISLSWLFDHIDANLSDISVSDLVNRFNQTTAEIEMVEKLSIPLEAYALAQIIEINANDTIRVSVPEWKQQALLPFRENLKLNEWYLIFKDREIYAWATSRAFGNPKDQILPAFCASDSWKKQIAAYDTILHVDNKSITHRPDMWGHRGIAREIAAMFDLPMRPFKDFITTIPVIESTTAATIKSSKNCSRIAILEGSLSTPCPSSLIIASRLLRVDSKPINAIVDLTNYVMFDLGHPMHAFDSANITNKKIIVRLAQNSEKLTILDGETLTLSSHDIVIADSKQPLSLTGVMGGAQSGISDQTTHILLEAGCFDAGTIRKTAARYKKRTESSARFEKSLDPYAVTNAIERFVRLAQETLPDFKHAASIYATGNLPQPVILEIKHNTIEQKLGITLDSKRIITLLSKLDFIPEVINSDPLTYRITIPSFRSTKDIKIKEDIIEEIGRLIGYNAIPLTLPMMKLAPKNLRYIEQARTIKNLLAHLLHLKEVKQYAFFDEAFNHTISFTSEPSATVQSPVSENWKQLVTTLMPHMLSAVANNHADHDHLRFFTSERIWKLHDESTISEHKSIAGIIWDKQTALDFYTGKNYLLSFFDALSLPITWKQVSHPTKAWFMPYQTAQLFYQDRIIGQVGIVPTTYLSSFAPGYAWAFEIDGDFLYTYKAQTPHYVPTPKYPPMSRDISILINVATSADTVSHIIANIDPRITKIELIDFFQRPEWVDKKSMTLRFIIVDIDKTLTKQEADLIWDRVADALKKEGATLR